MTIGIRGGTPATTSNTGGSPTLSITLTGTRQPQANDVLLIIHGNDWFAASNMPTPTVGGSTTGVNPVTNGAVDGGTNEAHAKSYTYVVPSTGDLTVAVTETGTADEEKSLTVYVYSGVDTTTPIDVAGNSVNTTGSTSQTAPSISPTASDSYLACHVNTGSGSSGTSYTPPSGMTETYDTDVGGFYSFTGAVLQLSASGATGVKTFAGTGNAHWAGLSFAMKTAGGAAAASQVSRKETMGALLQL